MQRYDKLYLSANKNVGKMSVNDAFFTPPLPYVANLQCGMMRACFTLENTSARFRCHIGLSL